MAPRVLHEALLGVQVAEAVVDLQARGVDLVDLLVDRDGFQEEAVERADLGDACEIRDRIGPPVETDVEISDLVQSGDVSRVLIEHAQVVLQGLIELALGDVLLGGSKELVAGRHLKRES